MEYQRSGRPGSEDLKPTYQTMKVATPESVISASYTVPAASDTDRKAIHAIKFEKSNATHGTPTLLTFPNTLGAFPFLAINSIVLELTYKLEFPALITAITITALIRLAPASMPAFSNAIVSGDLAVLEPLERSWLSFQGMRMPMKNIMPT